MAAGKYTTIPKRGKSDPQVDAIASNLEMLTGQKGGGGKRAVLVEDLQSLGIATFSQGRLRVDPDFQPGTGSGGGGGGVTPPTPPVVQPPTRPTGFVAVGGYQYISFSWDAPTYIGHSYTEVWLSQSDDFSTAVRIGVTAASIFGYNTEFGYSGYAWIRHVNSVGAIGALNDTNGTYVDTATNAQDLLEQLKGKIGEIHLDPDVDGQLEKLEDFQEWIEHSKAEGMLEEAITQDTYSIERRDGLINLTARIETEYYTGVDTDKAIASATTRLRAEIEDPNGSSVGANLSQNYYTGVKTDEAIAAAKLELQSNIDNVSANLSNNYYTSVQTDNAISSATTTLKAEIEDPNGSSLGATLANNYYTKVNTDQAISQATTTLKAEIENPDGTSVGASLEETKSALAETDGYQQALWGVKATAGDITASIGLVAKSDPSNPDISNAYFYVQDADMRVGYTVDDGTGQKDVVPIFGTIDNPDYDSSDPNSAKKLLVIDSANIKVADIRELTVGDLVADSIIANSTITAPNIVGGEINIGSNFSVSSNGNMVVKNANLSGTAQSSTQTSAKGWIIRNDGTCEFKDGVFRGTIYANEIIGDLVSARSTSGLNSSISSSGSWRNWGSPLRCTNNTGDSATVEIQGGILYGVASRSGSSARHAANLTIGWRLTRDGSVLNYTTVSIRQSFDNDGGISGRIDMDVINTVPCPSMVDTLSAGDTSTHTYRIQYYALHQNVYQSRFSGRSSGSVTGKIYRDGGAWS